MEFLHSSNVRGIPILRPPVMLRMPSMRTVVTAFVLAMLSACAPRVPAPAAAPAHRLPTCADDAPVPTASPADERTLFRKAHDQARSSPAWGRGPAAVELPMGFVRLPNPLRCTTDPDESNTGEEGLSDEDCSAQVAAYLFDISENEPRITATVRYFRRPAPAARPASLFRYVVGFWDQSREDITDIDDAASLRQWFNWVDEFSDPDGRRVVEWGFVQKGCERGELFERFIEDAGFLWHIRLEALGSIPSSELAEWLARFFDAPFAAPSSERRAALGREGTPR